MSLNAHNPPPPASGPKAIAARPAGFQRLRSLPVLRPLLTARRHAPPGTHDCFGSLLLASSLCLYLDKSPGRLGMQRLHP
ncbi:hypothetical protein AOQ84DRAFT_1702 [Glonium stellatum]|uniref:Uncharacterized protein n=1 Tax=Glonium stellatum TaxID=574774 RepID=A0A8E2JUK0_9PEZI|nr:hypothetical protein AOQ84DRAFT_1702 [Glonium stellatum]